MSVEIERAFLGAVIAEPTAWSRARAIHPLRASDFLLTAHQTIFTHLEQLAERSEPLDLPTLTTAIDSHGELETIGGVEYLAVLIEGTVPENVTSYARKIREQKKTRDLDRLNEQLGKAKTVKLRLELLDAMRKTLDGMRETLQCEGTDQNWRAIFHTQEEFENAPALRFAINGFLQEAGVTLIGGLAGHGKTLVMLSMVKALLEESPLFGHQLFSVSQRAERVIYLIPESSIGPFWSRIKMFHLEEFAREDRLLIRTLSAKEQVELTDPRMLAAVEGADIFLDSVVRFTTGSENDAENIHMFSDVLFQLLHAGARTITGCHHSPKSFEAAQSMTLENILRGSGDLGAMICTCWGVRQIDPARNRIFVQNVKPRDFEPCDSFILEGRPNLDRTGQFLMHAKPGEAGELRSYLELKGGRPPAPDQQEKIAQALEMRRQGKSNREIAAAIGVSHTCIGKWFWKYDTGKTPDEDLQ